MGNLIVGPSPAAVSILGQSGIPMVLAGSGSMGNNGALTLTTALAAIYASAYVYLPANAIVSGSAAGWYYATFSSTTAATVFNNTYSSGTPAVPASPTAFVTTGPGAYTGKSTTQTAYNISIPGNTIGVNGGLRVHLGMTWTNTAASKTTQLVFGGTNFANFAGTTTTSGELMYGFKNRGVAGAQVGLTFSTGVPWTGVSATALVYGSVDTTQPQTLGTNLTNATPATNNMVLEHITLELLPNVP